MFGFLKSLFAPQSSSETAKERLRVVLLSDHLSLAPEVVDLLKADLLEVIRKYVEIDEENADVTFEQRESEVAMLASVPILSVKERPASLRRPLAVSEAPRASVEESGAGSGAGAGTRRRRRRRNRRATETQTAPPTSMTQPHPLQA